MKVKKYSKVQENFSTLVQIFNAIPSSFFSAAAELALLKHPRRPTNRIPSKNDSGRLNLQWRFDILLHLLVIISPHFGTTPKFQKHTGRKL